MNDKSIYVKHAEYIIEQTVKGFELSVPVSIPKELAGKRACFVSIHKGDDSLRGCIGTIEPVCENLYEEIKRNAIAACTRDSRFESVSINELDDLHISVDIISIPEEVSDIQSLDPKVYGIIITDNHYKKAVLLPDLPSVKTIEEQINIVKRKAGIYSNGIEDLKIFRFTSIRYN